MEYKGYRIEHYRDHYVVNGPEGEIWTEDTVEEAKEAIDFLEEEAE